MTVRPITALVATLFLATLVPAIAGEWETLKGCRLLPNESNDGDSFHVEHDGKEYIFRLYFADSPESSMQVAERVAQQADDFGVGEEAVLRAGKDAAQFTERALRGKFEVTTKFQNARGASKLPRSYAVVRTADGKDLAMLLVEAGLARAHGVVADAPRTPSMADYQRAEDRARRGGYGIFGGKRLAKGQGLEENDPEPIEEQKPPQEEFSVTEAVFAQVSADPVIATKVRIQEPGVLTAPAAATGQGVAAAPPGSNRVNVNKATVKELEALPGIGPKTAAAIVDGRPYSSVEDLLRVPGIGPKRFEAIAPLVTE